MDDETRSKVVLLAALMQRVLCVSPISTERAALLLGVATGCDVRELAEEIERKALMVYSMPYREACNQYVDMRDAVAPWMRVDRPARNPETNRT